jgi:2-dehydropantoate 2-reductase
VRIGVLGAGAMGSLLAARLSTGGVAAVLLARPSEHVARMLAGGLLLEQRDGLARRLPLPIALDPAAAAHLDAVIVLVKRWATHEAVAPVAPFLRPETLVLSLQNGLGARDDLLAALPDHPPARVAHGITAQAALLVEPGVVRHTGTGPTVLGDPGGDGASPVRRLAEALTGAGWPTTVEPDIEPAIWRKLAVNAAINGISALAVVPNGAIAEQPGLRRLAERVAAEVGTVAWAHGIDTGDAAAATIAVAVATAANRSSMAQDLARGRRTEVEAIHGAVVRAAEERGIEVPLVELLAELIRAREQASLGRGTDGA